jgi:hypothetical protein
VQQASPVPSALKLDELQLRATQETGTCIVGFVEPTRDVTEFVGTSAQRAKCDNKSEKQTVQQLAQARDSLRCDCCDG